MQARPEAIDEMLEIGRTSIFKAMKAQEGFKEWILLVDRDSGKILSIPLWETEAGMKTGEESGYLQAQFDKVGFALTAKPVTEHFEVGLKG